MFCFIQLGDVLSRETIVQLDNSGRLARNLDRPPLKDTIQEVIQFLDSLLIIMVHGCFIVILNGTLKWECRY
jgi:hypothetical protein